jgi:hypothetical protein
MSSDDPQFAGDYEKSFAQALKLTAFKANYSESALMLDDLGARKQALAPSPITDAQRAAIDPNSMKNTIKRLMKEGATLDEATGQAYVLAKTATEEIYDQGVAEARAAHKKSVATASKPFSPGGGVSDRMAKDPVMVAFLNKWERADPEETAEMIKMLERMLAKTK